MLGQNCKTHNETDPLQALPERTWKAYFGQIARKAGLGAAMMGAGLGLSGFGGLEDKRADAGIVISMDPNADQRARDNGFGYSVEGGGNVGSLRLQSDDYLVYSSLVFVNPYTAISTAHQFSPTFGTNQQYSVRTGANYNSGSVFTPTSVFLHPNSAIDFAVIKFNNPIPILNEIVFAQARPTLNESIWITGYGESGSRATGYLTQDGFIRAGESTARLSAPLLGGDPMFYQNAFFQDKTSLPTQLRIAYGDSGGGIFNQNRELVGLGWASSSSISGSASAFVNVLAPEVQSFLSSHTTAVPEPSSLALSIIALGSGALAALRRRYRSNLTIVSAELRLRRPLFARLIVR